MPVYRVMVEKHWAALNEFWTNVYYASGASLSDIATVATALVNAERPLYTAACTITKTHVDDMVPDTDVFETIPRNLSGTRTEPTSSHLAPLFVVARVDFAVAGGGRPSRKYLRGVLWETDFNISALESGMLTLLNTYATAVASSGACDPQGQDIASGSAKNAPAMRQLRRGSKKKLTP